MDSLVLKPLNSIETHLSALITSFTQTNTFANAPQLARDLISDDDDLASALSLLQRHQQNYARILHLRAEAARLQELLKDTIRKCVSFRQEISHINPSILDADSDEEEGGGDGEVAKVDYHTLLPFAARIGKHNTIAAREAEAESLRRKIAAKSKDQTSPPAPPAVLNGVEPPLATGDGAAEEAAAVEARDETHTAETTAELLRIDNTIALQRAQMGMSFPDAGILRVGALGQLQLFMERQRQQSAGAGGENEANNKAVQEALDREVERLVRETEDIAEDTGTGTLGEEMAEDTAFSPAELKRFSTFEGERGQDTATVTATASAAGQPSTSTSQAQQVPRPPKPPQPKRKLNLDLDFPDSDEEDED
ncbi:uncharacterized protein Z520_04364 [Fonsecaea multimorphosa CBS 102226]|uniref:Mediator of RNA polymerase II transcription subunit 4 n=1 Tax=Fonsecaea multimorphosa CBS 102226 TaxID=1442371 RepID=A0A0D2KSL8_9EURO|nr:uncharacterized protein Z520_04364 [Fonsecaea multimorphosa CBS 102226]KIX99728.1 hypothetical protein Z520_04364 [Fonsecaea multimorphosa CBS 102226]OAL26776.1 hypothetical protein AYO22_04129 [Fonsecaea multimorphosa]